MTQPGGFPGDPAGRQPHPMPGGYSYPPGAYGATPPPAYPASPPAYSLPPQMPPGAYPPPPPYHAYNAPNPGPYGSPYPPGYGSQPATNGMAIGSLVSSLVGFPGYFMCLPFVGSVIGVILGIVALNQIKSRHQRGKGMAIAGIAIGGICLVASVIVVLLHPSTLFW